MENRSETRPLPPDPRAYLSSSSVIPFENAPSPNSVHINCLPTEIIIQILLFWLTKVEVTSLGDHRFGMVSLRRLRSVCARWNDTILGEPIFWTHIDIRVESSFAVQLKLMRSGALPLTIRYVNLEGVFDSERPNPEFDTIMNSIGRHTHRWKSISFWAGYPELSHLVGYLQTSRLPEMVNLEIRRNPLHLNSLAWALGEAAELWGVVLDGGALPWNCSELRSLVHIEIEGAIEHLDLLVDVIRASQSLETLCLKDTIFNDGDVEEQQRIGWPDESHPPLLPRLCDINISGFASPAAIACVLRCVLRCIRAPNVTRLEISEIYTGERQAGSDITRALTTYHGNESILLSMLHNTPPLTKIELCCVQVFIFLELDDPVRDLFCSLELSLLHPDWAESAGMIADVVRRTDVIVCLAIENLPYTLIAPLLLRFSMAKELKLTNSEMPVEEILTYLHTLSQPINLGGEKKMWVCPQLEELRLLDNKPAEERIAIVEAATAVKHARRDNENQSTRQGDGSYSDEVYGGIRVVVEYLFE